jgi:hypothetical protein
LNIFNACKSILVPCFLLAYDGLAGSRGLLAEQAQTRRPAGRARGHLRAAVASSVRKADWLSEKRAADAGGKPAPSTAAQSNRTAAQAPSDDAGR